MKEYYEDLWERLPARAGPGPDAGDAGRARRERFLRAELRGGERALDLGCGDGWALAVMVACGASTVVGADVAEAALARSRERGSEAELVLAPFDGPLPLEDNRFDVVWAGEVIEHVADTARWLSEARRVLVPGGRLLVTTPNVTRLALLTRGIDRFAPPLGDHLHLYTARSLREVLGEFGFEPVRVRSAGPTLLARAVRA